MTYAVEQRGETQRLNEELARIQRCRVLAAWAEIRAERLAREERIMAALRPKIGDDND
jgi:hypothetical protein